MYEIFSCRFMTERLLQVALNTNTLQTWDVGRGVIVVIFKLFYAFVFHTNGLIVDADYIPILGFFFSGDFGNQKGCRLSTNASNIRPFMVILFGIFI